MRWLSGVVVSRRAGDSPQALDICQPAPLRHPDRAIPWTRLILHDARLPADLNLDVSSRLSALAAWATLALLALGFWSPWAWIGMLLGMVTIGGTQRRSIPLFRPEGWTWVCCGCGRVSRALPALQQPDVCPGWCVGLADSTRAGAGVAGDPVRTPRAMSWPSFSFG